MRETANYAWEVLKTALRFKEITAPSAGQIADNTLGIYAKDKAGVSHLYYKDDADVEHDLIDTTSAAPIGANYLVGTANGDLTAEIVVGTTPGGELGGTWASPTVDATHSGSAHHAAVTLGVGSDSALSLSGQELTLADVATQAELNTHAGAVDPHSVYRLESADHSHISTGLQAGQLDHGAALTGLSDDDHAAYLLASDATSRALFASNWLDLTDTGATTLHSHAGGLTGSGVAGRVAFWDGTSSLSSDADFTFSVDTLSIDNITLPTTTATEGIIRSAASTLLHTLGGTQSTFLGIDAGNLTNTGNYNTGVGYNALKAITSGVANTAVGRLAGSKLTTAEFNVAIGYAALQDTTTTSGNTAIGDRALNAWTGTNAIAIGSTALVNAASGGTGVIGIGVNVMPAHAGANYATGVGSGCLVALTTGDNNSAFGRNALGGVTTGEENTGCGIIAGQIITTGSRNTFLGSQSNAGSVALTEATAIGYLAIVSQSKYIMLGTATECVGIGGAARPTGSGGLIFPDGTALSAMASNTAGLYADSMGANVELMCIDESDRIRSLAWPRTARVSVQFDKAADTTLADVTGLTHTINAGKSYDFEALLHVDASLAGGSKFAIAGTATATSIIYHIDLLDNTSNAHTITSRQTALAGSAGQAGTTAGLCRIIGTIVVNAAGTLTVQFAQNAANGTSSVLINSSFTIDQLP